MTENITGTVVKVDNVIPYMSSPQQSDTMRSEVSVRVFDAESNRETIIGKLNRNAKTLQQIFHTYFLRVSKSGPSLHLGQWRIQMVTWRSSASGAVKPGLIPN